MKHLIKTNLFLKIKGDYYVMKQKISPQRTQSFTEDRRGAGAKFTDPSQAQDDKTDKKIRVIRAKKRK
ncbi:hypothetical protein [Bacteroides sp.]